MDTQDDRKQGSMSPKPGAPNGKVVEKAQTASGLNG